MVVYEKEELPVVPSKKALIGLQPLDRVKILTSRFGRVYVKGCDATTGYLQTKQRVPVYA